MLSILLDVKGKSVLVVGGGPVGQRKALTAASAGASVRLLALEPPPADFPVDAIDWRVERFSPEHLHGQNLVFASASVEVNEQIVNAAKSLGIWVNSSTGGDGDFELPAVLKRGAFTVSVSTGGAAPAFARRVRDRLEQDLDSAVEEFVALLAEMRVATLTRLSDPIRRRELLDRWSDWPWLARVRSEGKEPVRTAMIEELEKQADR